MKRPSDREFLDFLANVMTDGEQCFTMDEEFQNHILDSTGAFMLATAIEDAFGVTIPLQKFPAFKKPGDTYISLIEELEAHHG